MLSRKPSNSPRVRRENGYTLIRNNWKRVYIGGLHYHPTLFFHYHQTWLQEETHKNGKHTFTSSLVWWTFKKLVEFLNKTQNAWSRSHKQSFWNIDAKIKTQRFLLVWVNWYENHLLLQNFAKWFLISVRWRQKGKLIRVTCISIEINQSLQGLVKIA